MHRSAWFGPLLLSGLFLLYAGVIVLCVPWQQDGDDLLTTLMSLQKLTVYYWEQDRFGNLLPALTTWIADPTLNAETQIVLRVGCGLVAPVFFTAQIFPRAADVWSAALLADGLLLLTGGTALTHQIYFVASPYGPSLACAGLAALILLHAPAGGWRGAGAALAGGLGLLAAHVVNVTLPVVILPVLVLLAVLRPAAARTRLVILTVAAAAVAFIMAKVFGAPYTTSTSLHLSWDGIVQFWSAIQEAIGWPTLLAGALPIAAALGICRSRTPRVFLLLLLAASLTIPAAFVLIASSAHVANNGYHARYAVPLLLMLLAAGGAGALVSLRALIPGVGRRHLVPASAALAMLLVGWAHLPASAAADTGVIGHGKAGIAQAVASRYVALSLDGIAGDYWDVWPAVFATEQAHHGMGWRGADVLGISHRSKARRDVFLARLAAQGHLRIGCIDMAPADCAVWTERAMGVAGLRGEPFAAPEAIGGGHQLYYVTILPPP